MQTAQPLKVNSADQTRAGVTHFPELQNKDSCTLEHFRTLVSPDHDKARLERAISALRTPDGRSINLAAFHRFGLADFITRKPSTGITAAVGQCVLLLGDGANFVPKDGLGNILTLSSATGAQQFSCDVCGRPISGSWYSCRESDYDVCNDCIAKVKTAEREKQGAVGVVRGVEVLAGKSVFTIKTKAGLKTGVLQEDLLPCSNMDLVSSMQRHYLQTISERVGSDPDPRGDLWKVQAMIATKAQYVKAGFLYSMQDMRWETYIQELKYLQNFDDYIKDSKGAAKVQQLVEAGWPRHHAGMELICSDCNGVLEASVRERRCDYAALLHKYHRALAARAEAQGVAPVGYKHLEGFENGVGDFDSQWKDLAQNAVMATSSAAAAGPDMGSGFLGSTFMSTTTCSQAGPLKMTPTGITAKDRFTGAIKVADSPVVRFLSEGTTESESGNVFHTAVVINNANMTFPPMALFKVVQVKEKGWIYDGTDVLIANCRELFEGRAPTPAISSESHGKACVTKQGLWDFLETFTTKQTALVVEGPGSTSQQRLHSQIFDFRLPVFG
jgi:hypothetical protein